MVDLTLPHPVRLQIGGGLDKHGNRQPARVFNLKAGLNRLDADFADIQDHPYIKLVLMGAPRIAEPQVRPFSGEQLKLLDQLGLSPEQRKLLDQINLTPQQRAALAQPRPDLSPPPGRMEDDPKPKSVVEKTGKGGK